MVDKSFIERSRKDPFNLDPLGVRRVTLGGDPPGLQAETDRINKTEKSVPSQEEKESKNSTKKK